MISVLILTFNEEVNIADCLGSVRWADDVLVVDSYSTDRTVEIAHAGGARVLQRAFDSFASQRNFGLLEGGLKHPWVLHLDADERISPELYRELLEVVARQEKDAFRVPSRMIFQGVWLRRSGMYPAYQVRFGKREALLFKQIGHGQRETLPPERLGMLRHPLLHYSFSKGLADWFERHNRYSSAEAEYALEILSRGRVDWPGLVSGNTTRRRRALKDLSFRLPFRPVLRFMYMYVLRGGFLDGRVGLSYCLLVAMYEQMTSLKLRELQNHRRAPRVADAAMPLLQPSSHHPTVVYSHRSEHLPDSSLYTKSS